MKFTDGFWLLRPGVHAAHPVEVLDVTTSGGELTISAPTQPVRHRGDLLGGPVVTLRCTSPMPDVVGVTITHLTGEVRRGPEYALNAEPDTSHVSVSSDDDYTAGRAVTAGNVATLEAGALSLRVARGGPWRLDFVADGRVLTVSGPKAMAIVDTDDGHHYIREQLDLGVDDYVYGLGERFGPLVKNGQSVDIWNADGGTASEQAYKNVPFLLTNRGYGIFVNSPGRVSFEVGSEAVSRLQFSVEGQSLQYFLIYGPTPKEILRKYTALTGRPARLPAWSYGLWLSTSFTTSYDEETVTSFVDGMAQRDLPLSVFHFDTFWMRELHWCDFEWDARHFPDPRGMLERLGARGLKTCVWINPYVAQRSALFAEGRDHGYLLKRPNGDVWQWDRWQPGMAIVDFTNPEAREWWTARLEGLLDAGVDCFKSDFGERIPTDVVWFDGSDPERMHNHYTYLYNQTVFDLLRKHRGEGEAVVFARSATAGSQQFPVHWGGDCESTFEAMAGNLRGGLSLGMCGFGYWSHDIGGFEGTPDADVFKRWIAFGLLSSHSRLHGNQSYRVPWEFDDEAVEVLRLFTRLKMRLMPYLLHAADQAHSHGVPIMRAMVVEHPDDPACTHLERQYMLGDDLLVAPVLSADGDIAYYVPAGRWTQVLTGEVVEGPRWVAERHGFTSVPLLARPGSVIPFGAVEDRPEYAYADGVTLHAYELPDRCRVTTPIVSAAGEVLASFVTSRSGDTVRVEADGDMAVATAPPSDWSVLLVGVRSVGSVEGGTLADHDQGVMVHATGRSITIGGAV